MTRTVWRLAAVSAALAFVVIIFGAFVRLSNAGLSCPDWPTCYGRVAWPTGPEGVDHAATAIRAVDGTKAWREQVHRMIAGGLGLLVLAMALVTARGERGGRAAIAAATALVLLGIPLYMGGWHALASALVLVGEGILIGWALRVARTELARLGGLTLAVIIFQAVLGMWTVTWLLKPIVVMAHLLGGLLTFSLLVYIAWRAAERPLALPSARVTRRLLALGLGLVIVQIAFGGWTSANYAALACGTDYPTCLGALLPSADYGEGFVLWRGVGVDYEGGVLDGRARIAIHLVHRSFGLVVLGYLLWLASRLVRIDALRSAGALVATLVVAQVGLGIANVMLGLPLSVAVTHTAGAALLLMTLVTLLARVRPKAGGPDRA